MSAKTAAEREALLRLADALVEDVFAATDRDLLAEAAEDQVDVERLAGAVRDLLSEVENEQGKARLQAARAAVDADRRRPARIIELDAIEARRRLTQVLARRPEVAQRLTLAARKAEDLSDADVRLLLESLEELGIAPPSNGERGKP